MENFISVFSFLKTYDFIKFLGKSFLSNYLLRRFLFLKFSESILDGGTRNFCNLGDMKRVLHLILLANPLNSVNSSIFMQKYVSEVLKFVFRLLTHLFLAFPPFQQCLRDSSSLEWHFSLKILKILNTKYLTITINQFLSLPTPKYLITSVLKSPHNLIILKKTSSRKVFLKN